jgi:hypothetical protein
MHVILRTAEELFEDTARRAQRSLNLKAVINGNYYDLSTAGYMDAMVGHDPVEAKETTPIGLVVSGGRVVAGNPQPERFFVAFQPPVGPPRLYKFDQGDPPTASREALGGLGPLILHRLKFGSGNKYGPGTPAGAPDEGAPPADTLPFLVQRNNNNYRALAKLGPRKGKVAIAESRASQKLLLLVQPDGAPTGIALDALRDKMVSVGVDDAVFLDGSDSAMLMINADILIPQGENKDETNIVGIGFG